MDIEHLIKDGFHYHSAGKDLYCILQPGFEKRLSFFLDQYQQILLKQQSNPIPYNEYNQLPFTSSANSEQWIFRRSTFNLISKLLKHNRSLKILEIGGWNGWLTHHIAEWGHEVVTVDYFLDDINGLAAKNHYPQQWIAIQTDISNIDFFKTTFDIIIINHCLAYSETPLNFINHLKPLLSKEGKMILTGLTFFKNAKAKRVEVERFKKDHQDKYGFDIFLNPTKGYLDADDKKLLETIGIVFNNYPEYTLPNLLSYFVNTKPVYMYGIYEAP